MSKRSKARALRVLQRRPGSGSTPHDRDRRPPCLATPLSFTSGRASEQTSAVLTTSEDPLQAPRSRQALVCSRSNTLVVFVPTDKTGQLRPPHPRVRSVSDLQIPIAPAQPNRAPRGFLLARLSDAGPPSSPARLQRAGVQNISMPICPRCCEATMPTTAYRATLDAYDGSPARSWCCSRRVTLRTRSKDEAAGATGRAFPLLAKEPGAENGVVVATSAQPPFFAPRSKRRHRPRQRSTVCDRKWRQARCPQCQPRGRYQRASESADDRLC